MPGRPSVERPLDALRGFAGIDSVLVAYFVEPRLAGCSCCGAGGFSFTAKLKRGE
jgi:hypothetical protein